METSSMMMMKREYLKEWEWDRARVDVSILTISRVSNYSWASWELIHYRIISLFISLLLSSTHTLTHIQCTYVRCKHCTMYTLEFKKLSTEAVTHHPAMFKMNLIRFVWSELEKNAGRESESVWQMTMVVTTTKTTTVSSVEG